MTPARRLYQAQLLADMRDVVDDFLADRFPSGADKIKATDLYDGYAEWAQAHGHEPGSSTLFGREVKNVRGITADRDRSGAIYSIKARPLASALLFHEKAMTFNEKLRTIPPQWSGPITEVIDTFDAVKMGLASLKIDDPFILTEAVRMVLERHDKGDADQ